LEVFPARTLKVIDGLDLLEAPPKLLELVCERPRVRLAGFLILDQG